LKKNLLAIFVSLALTLVGPLAASAESDKPLIKNEKNFNVKLYKPTNSDKRKMDNFLADSGFNYQSEKLSCTHHKFPGAVKQGAKSSSIAQRNASIVFARGRNLMSYSAKKLGTSLYEVSWSLLEENQSIDGKKSWFSCTILPLP
jgi:hypothetical protein